MIISKMAIIYKPIYNKCIYKKKVIRRLLSRRILFPPRGLAGPQDRLIRPPPSLRETQREAQGAPPPSQSAI